MTFKEYLVTQGSLNFDSKFCFFFKQTKVLELYLNSSDERFVSGQVFEGAEDE